MSINQEQLNIILYFLKTCLTLLSRNYLLDHNGNNQIYIKKTNKLYNLIKSDQEFLNYKKIYIFNNSYFNTIYTQFKCTNYKVLKSERIICYKDKYLDIDWYERYAENKQIILINPGIMGEGPSCDINKFIDNNLIPICVKRNVDQSFFNILGFPNDLKIIIDYLFNKYEKKIILYAESLGNVSAIKCINNYKMNQKIECFISVSPGGNLQKSLEKSDRFLFSIVFYKLSNKFKPKYLCSPWKNLKRTFKYSGVKSNNKLRIKCDPSLNKFINNDIPVLIIQSKDDNMAMYNSDLIKKFKDDTTTIILTEKGGHLGFWKNYDEQWLSNIVNKYIKYSLNNN